MSAKHFWRMTQGKVVEGVFAINKPTGISSAQVLRDLQKFFNPSALFRPWLSVENSKRQQETPNQRRRRRQKDLQVKIGHGGTLDPLATGVLITGVGRGTKHLQSFLECTKTYETIVLFGASTDSYDRVGRILKRAPYTHITRDMVEKSLGNFRGKIMQLPPLYSALKMNGKPLYEYAREGKEIPREIEKRAVEVKELELLDWMEGGTHEHRWPTEEAGEAELDVAERLWQNERDQEADANIDAGASNLMARKRKLEENQDELVSERPASKRKMSKENATMSGGLQSPDRSSDLEKNALHSAKKEMGPPAARIRMTVTSGFYVRSLCHDLGEAVGSQAIMAELIRTRQGQFELRKNVLEYDDLAEGEKVWGPKVEGMLDTWMADQEKSAYTVTADGNPNTKGDARNQEERIEAKTGEVSAKGEEAGDVKEEAGDVKEEAGYVKEEAGDVKEEAGYVKEEAGDVKEEAGYVKQEAGDVKEEAGDVKEEAGDVKVETMAASA